MSNSSLFTQALLRSHSLDFFAVHETRRNFLCPFISNASRRVSSFFLSVEWDAKHELNLRVPAAPISLVNFNRPWTHHRRYDNGRSRAKCPPVGVCGCWGSVYQPRPRVVDRGTTTRYGSQLRDKRMFPPDE